MAPSRENPPNKTQPGPGDVRAFVDSVPDARRRADALSTLALMTEVTGARPELWGTSMVGFGRQRYEYESGRSGETFTVGFAPRKAALTLYGLIPDGDDAATALLARLGPHTTGKACLYIKRLDAVDRDVLAELIRRTWRRR